MTDNNRPSSTVADMRQHFHQYFEFLLEAERTRLLGKLVPSASDDVGQLFNEVDERMAYLKGALRIGQLLCLISSEETKARYGVLARERQVIREVLALRCGISDPEKKPQHERQQRDFRSLLKAVG